MDSQKACWEKVSALMLKETGVLLSADQTYLLEPRLQPLAQANKFSSVEAFVESAQSFEQGKHLRKLIVDAMTTHESYFFRDSFFWGAIQSVILKDFKESNRKSLRIWSAACSFGQEAYSLAMLLLETDPELSAGTEIFASDVSAGALERAKSGLYSTVEVNRGLTAPRLVRHFEKAPGGFVIKDALKKKVKWSQESILTTSHARSEFDIVMCRNVMIYFDSQNRQIALRNLLASCSVGGYVGLGTSEALLKPQVAPGWFKVTAESKG